MKTQLKLTIILLIFTTALSFMACDPPSGDSGSGAGTGGDASVSIVAIPGIPAPVTGNTPVTTITETAQYTGTITWSGSPVTFAAFTTYTATITLTPKPGFTLSGITANCFTINGVTGTNDANSGVITAVFSETGAAPVPVSFTGVTQDGGTTGTTNTTSLTLTFDVDPTAALTADNITVTGASKGALTGTGTTRSLAISNITVADGETVSVAISNPSGYLISGSPIAAVVYKDTRVAVTFQSAVQNGGTTGTADTTSLTLTFDVDPTAALTADNITVTGATKGALTGSGTTTRSLAISDITVADGATVSVAITSPSGYTISGSPKTAVVYKIDPIAAVTYREMVSITGGTYTQTDGTNSFSHTISNFSLGQYEVTYELWYTVYQWAITHGYTFANAGKEGNDGTEGAAPTAAKYEPVTTVNWRDTIVWLNAYSEMSGFTPCYTDSSSTTIKDSQDTNATVCDGAVCDWTANGYRLPTEGEWQYAASNKGATPYNYASGTTAAITDAIATGLVAWYNGNSSSSTKPVGTTTNPSALTLWDMSGNVHEWCWDWHGTYPGASTDYRGAGSGSYRIVRGGSWYDFALYLRVGSRSHYNPNGESVSIGFRVARTN